jgi:hypothetical protein
MELSSADFQFQLWQRYLTGWRRSRSKTSLTLRAGGLGGATMIRAASEGWRDERGAGTAQSVVFTCNTILRKHSSTFNFVSIFHNNFGVFSDA